MRWASMSLSILKSAGDIPPGFRERGDGYPASSTSATPLAFHLPKSAALSSFYCIKEFAYFLLSELAAACPLDSETAAGGGGVGEKLKGRCPFNFS